MMGQEKGFQKQSLDKRLKICYTFTRFEVTRILVESTEIPHLSRERKSPLDSEAEAP